MKWDYWIYEDDNLIVEKYAKVLNSEHFEARDGRLYRQMNSGKQILQLVDFSEATLFNIQYDEIKMLFNDLNKRIGNASVKVAMYTGDNDKDDYMKMSTFSKHETDQIQIKNFVELYDAFTWLDLPDKTRQKVWDNLH